MKRTLPIIFLFLTSFGFSQDPQGFDKMLNKELKGTVEQLNPADLNAKIKKQSNIFLLDTRELNEYKVSHIKGAKFVSYNDFNMNLLNGIPKDAYICVYCSVGVRSEHIGEKLNKAGYKHVYNLRGGLFSWANQGFPIVNTKGKITKKVHGFDEEWSKYLNKEKVEVELK
ncbi:rhodanese-like domain-containing protein [Paracrocinitomix mangrovi]|uniref:rhodanese-like domain-containing protein n=1 Tax=Paracrocinitomix mangrovi TaxID=2862509 RepID=UPI001C8E5650|nr:rhodanese-like domain-containing protein [Paracrocinitomix mangrovi]UKN01068.1 rhodanese-like domain-containing protein [Paracrocinitomix mangrovi]